MTERRLGFPLQLALATVIICSAVFGLVLLGRSQPSELPPPHSSALSSAPADARSAPALVGRRHPRALLPTDAWLIADFRGDLLGESPFADQPGACAHVPPPARVAVALLPPTTGSQDRSPGLLLAAPRVEGDFWRCVKERVVRAGGRSVDEQLGLTVLQSPSGLIALGPDRAMIFLTDPARLRSALEVLTGVSASAHRTGRHAELLAQLPPLPNEPALRLTLDVPPGWLDGITPDANKSPLVHLRAGTLRLQDSGAAVGALHCAEPGCAELLAFVERAKNDLLPQLSPAQQAAVVSALRLEHLPGHPGRTGRLIVSWDPRGFPLGQLLNDLSGRLFR